MSLWKVGAAWWAWSPFTTWCSWLVDEGRAVGIFYMDISKIFYTVSHGILQKKLSLPAYGLNCRSKVAILKQIPQCFARKKNQKTSLYHPEDFFFLSSVVLKLMDKENPPPKKKIPNPCSWNSCKCSLGRKQSPWQASLQGRADHFCPSWIWSVFPMKMQDSLERRAWLGKIREFKLLKTMLKTLKSCKLNNLVIEVATLRCRKRGLHGKLYSHVWCLFFIKVDQDYKKFK